MARRLPGTPPAKGVDVAPGSVRAATPDDAAVLARVHRDTVLVAYAGIFPVTPS